jgi:hypothetical protein
MGAVTYPDPDVLEMLEQGFAPVRVNLAENEDVRSRYGAAQTPTLLVLGPDDREWRRHSGFLSPEELLAELALGRLVEAVEEEDYEAAGRRLEAARRWALEDDERRAEALYYTAIAAYRATDDPSELSEGWSRLLEEYPDSEWGRRVEFLRED